MAEKSISAKTEEIYGRRNEKGKELKNYQDAEKQLLAIQAAQQANLRAGKANNLAQFRNTQNLIGAGNVLQQAKPQQTQQVAVNPQTQQILQKYGANKPGTVTKRMQSRQETPQHITINNNTTNTTHNQVNAGGGPATQQVIKPQRDNSNEKFKLWLNNTLARQQEDYARREKDYDKRESSLERDSNKMLRKLGEFSKDMMEKMDPRKIGSTATSQIKSLLFIFGFQYLASNWAKILKTVSSIESSIKSGLTYIGLYKKNKDGTGNFCFEPGKSQLALDLKGLFTGHWDKSRLWGTGGISGGSPFNAKDGGVLGGENGLLGGLRKVLFGNLDTGGKDKGLLELVKEFFVNQGKKRMAAAKMIEKPDFNLGDIAGTLSNIGDYLGQLLGIFLGDPDEAVRSMMKSKINITAAQKAWSFTDTKTGEKEDYVDESGNMHEDVKQGVGAYYKGADSQRGLSLGALDKKGNLRTGDAEGSISQTSDLVLAYEDAVSGKRIDTERVAAGFSRTKDYLAANGNKAAVSSDFLKTYLTDSEIQELEQEGKIKRNVQYRYAIRDVDVQDDNDYYGRIGKEQQKELNDYLAHGIAGAGSAGDVYNFIKDYIPGPQQIIMKAADALYRMAKGTFSGEKELERLKEVAGNTWGVIWRAALGPFYMMYKAGKGVHDFFYGDSDKPGLGTEKRKVLLSNDQIKSSDVLLANSEYVDEISQEALDYIQAKYGIDPTLTSSTDTRYYDQVQQSLANVMVSNNKGKYSDSAKDIEVTTADGKKKTVHLTAEEASILENTGYYAGKDADAAKFINEKKYRNQMQIGNDAFSQTVFGWEEARGNGNGGVSTIYHSGIADKAFETTFTDFYKNIDSDDSLKEYLTFSENDKEGLKWDDHLKFAFTGAGGIASTYGSTKELTVKDADGKVQSVKQIFESAKGKSAEELRNIYDSLARMDFNPGNDAVELMKKSSPIQKGWTNLFEEIYLRGTGARHLGSKFKPHKIDFQKLYEDPVGYGNLLINEIMSTFPDDPKDLWGKIPDAEYKIKKDKYTKEIAEKEEAIKHIKSLVSYFLSFKNNADEKLRNQRKTMILSEFSKLINSRVEAESTRDRDLKLAGEYTTNSYKRAVASSDNPMLRISNSSSGGAVSQELDALNEWSNEWEKKDEQYSKDLQENAVTSKVVSVIDGLRGMIGDVKDSFDEYSEEAKGFFGEMFNNAKGVINGFLRNLDYTKVSMARWPNGRIIKRDDNLLLWHCFNSNNSVEVDFKVKGADGRFGAGRLSHRTDSDKAAGVNVWDPHTNSEENQQLGIAGLYDRIHSGQDISGIYMNGREVGGIGTPFYAPFNGYITAVVNSLSSGSGRQVMIRQKKEGGTYGRYSVFVCHLSSVSKFSLEAFANKTLVEKGTELGRMGGSGTKEDSYGPHFHINILDHDAGGPFDGPLEGDLPGIVHGYKGFLSSIPTVYNAVDPLFVFCDENVNSIKNRTLYMSSEKKVVTVDDANPSKVDRYKGGDIDMTVAPDGTGNGESPEGKEEEKGIIDSILDYLKEFSMKLMSGDFKDILGDAKEAAGNIGDKAKSIYNDFFGKYRNKSISFRKSSRTYTGPVTGEMVNYKNYQKNPGAVGLGPDGKLLTETQWRNKVFDMSGSDPSALHIGEFLKGAGNENLKTASEVGGEAQAVVDSHGGNTSTTTNAETVNTTDNSSSSTTTTTNNTTLPLPRDIAATAELKAKEMKRLDIYGDFNQMVKDMDKDKDQEVANNTAEANEIAKKVLNAIVISGETNAAAMDKFIQQQAIGNAYLSTIKTTNPSNTCMVGEFPSLGSLSNG